MWRNSAELKRQAREILTHRYKTPMGAMVVTELITVILLLPFSWNITDESSVREWTIYYFAAFIISLIASLFRAGCLRIALNMARGERDSFSELFYVFRNHPDKYILATLVLTLLSFVPAVPFLAVVWLIETPKISAALLAALILSGVVMLAGIVLLFLNYGMYSYILLDRQQIGIAEAFRESRRMMRGNKGRLLYLNLAFLGWQALGVLSLGIGFLWVQPYMTQTQTCFYLEVSGERPLNGERKEKNY